MADLPKFDAPPVVEVALSVQFEALKDLTSAHIGWYWRDHLMDDWPQVIQTQRLDDVFERFGDDSRKWQRRGIRFEQVSPASRLQFLTSNDDRMIQIQDSRFAYNWRKSERSDQYPSFETLHPEFETHFDQFCHFVENSDIGRVNSNAWEVTYVNHIPAGSLWQSPNDWKKILPALASPAEIDAQELEAIGSEWHFVIGKNLGKLHVSINHGRIGSDTGTEILVLKLVARGPVNDGFHSQGLKLGHEHVIRFFAEMTSEHAHKGWKRNS